VLQVFLLGSDTNLQSRTSDRPLWLLQKRRAQLKAQLAWFSAYPVVSQNVINSVKGSLIRRTEVAFLEDVLQSVEDGNFR
jgi:predicted component of type VI protein secretion system